MNRNPVGGRPDTPPAYNTALTQHYVFLNPPLGYAYDALEPYIDELTMRLHRDRHLQTYVGNLNAALEKYPQYQDWTLEKLITDAESLPPELRVPVERNAGGVYNHIFYFQGIAPGGSNKPIGKTAEAIAAAFGGGDGFRARFKDAALSVFGSGYAWLALTPEHKAVIVTTANQQTPLIDGLIPLLNIDVWEHAYYLKHYNDRGAYIDDWQGVVNWNAVESRLPKLG
ncbi:MAG: superoxide dismutase [Firmicutes bacterium]|nr:superoxide dismutase [Bacillota bacterium]